MPIQLSKDNGSGRDIVTFEKQDNENIVMSRPEAEKPSFLNQLVKVAIAITIFGAVTYGEGWVNYTALAALFLVYLVAIG